MHPGRSAGHPAVAPRVPALPVPRHRRAVPVRRVAPRPSGPVPASRCSSARSARERQLAHVHALAQPGVLRL